MRKHAIEVIGWSGTVAILAAYAMNSLGVLSAAHPSYQILNLFGALGVGLITWLRKAWQGFVLNAIWALVALFALLQLAITS